MLPCLGSEKLVSKHSQKTMACVKYSTLLNVQDSKPEIQSIKNHKRESVTLCIGIIIHDMHA